MSTTLRDFYHAYSSKENFLSTFKIKAKRSKIHLKNNAFISLQDCIIYRKIDLNIDNLSLGWRQISSKILDLSLYQLSLILVSETKTPKHKLWQLKKKSY